MRIINIKTNGFVPYIYAGRFFTFMKLRKANDIIHPDERTFCKMGRDNLEDFRKDIFEKIKAFDPEILKVLLGEERRGDLH